jgi:hypothetical protein
LLAAVARGANVSKIVLCMMDKSSRESASKMNCAGRLSVASNREREKRDEPLLRVLHVWLLVVVSLRRHDGQDVMNATMRKVVRFTEGLCCCCRRLKSQEG